MNEYIKLENISKRFNNVKAVDNVTMSVNLGEITSIVGDNGAGKSTLIKIINGSLNKDSGKIFLDKKEVDNYNTLESIKNGIKTVYQDLNICDDLTVVENIFLGQEISRLGFLNKKNMEQKSQDILEDLSINICDINSKVKNLSGGQRQAVAIVRCIVEKSKILIMDEPTAAMGIRETQNTIKLIKKLKSNGVGIILISHDLKIITELSDKVFVLRNGKLVNELVCTDINEKSLIYNMSGVI